MRCSGSNTSAFTLRAPARSCFAALLAIATAVLCANHALAATRDCMNSDSAAWQTTDAQRKLYRDLMTYMSCPSDDPASGRLADKVACNYFVGKVLNDVYRIPDFSAGPGRWLLANQVHDYVTRHDDVWSRLGVANDQRVLDDAAAGASNGQAVIAVSRGSPGHVALILPGQPKRSQSWGGLNAPNSASFSLGNVDKAYVFCRLSYAFADPSQVDIFWRVKK